MLVYRGMRWRTLSFAVVGFRLSTRRLTFGTLGRVITFAGDDLAIAKEVSDHMPVVASFRTDATFRDRKPD